MGFPGLMVAQCKCCLLRRPYKNPTMFLTIEVSIANGMLHLPIVGRKFTGKSKTLRNSSCCTARKTYCLYKTMKVVSRSSKYCKFALIKYFITSPMNFTSYKCVM